MPYLLYTIIDSIPDNRNPVTLISQQIVVGLAHLA